MADPKVSVRIGADSTELARGLDDSSSKIASWRGKVEGQFQSLQSTVAGTFAGLGAAVAVGGVIALGREILSTTAEFQRLNASLLTVTGSQQAATQAFQLMKVLAKETPYELSEVTQAYIDLRTRGFSGSKDSMVALGNIASSFGRSFTDAVRAYASAAMGETEAIKAFGVQAKVEGDKITLAFRGQKETIKRDAASIEAYFLKLGSTVFAGGMARQMDTLGGQFSNLKDVVAASLNEIGEAGLGSGAAKALAAISGVIVQLTPAVVNLMRSLSETGGVLSSLASGPGSILVEALRLTLQLLSSSTVQWLLLAGIANATLVPTLVKLGTAVSGVVTTRAFWAAGAYMKAWQAGGSIFDSVAAGAKGAATGAMSLVNPVTLLTAAVLVGGLAYERFSTVAQRAAEDQVKTSQAAVEAATAIGGQSSAMERNNKILADSKASSEAKAKALEANKQIVADLVAQYPQYASIINDEISKNHSLLDVKVRLLKMEQARLRAEQEAAQERKKKADEEAALGSQVRPGQGTEGLEAGIGIAQSRSADEGAGIAARAKQLQSISDALEATEAVAVKGGKEKEKITAWHRLQEAAKTYMAAQMEEATARGEVLKNAEKLEADYLEAHHNTYGKLGKDEAAYKDKVAHLHQETVKKAKEAEAKKTEDLRKAAKIREEITAEEAQIRLDVEQAAAEKAYDDGKITQEQYVRALMTFEQRRYDIEKAAILARRKLAKDESERARADLDLTKLDAKHGSAMTGYMNQWEQADGTGAFKGFMQGLRDLQRQSLTTFQTMRNAAKTMGDGISSALGDSVSKLVSGQIKLGQVGKTVWNSLRSTVASAVGSMVKDLLKKRVAMALNAVMHRLFATEEMATDATATAAKTANTTTQVSLNATKQTSDVATGVTGFWSTASSFGPILGPILAVAACIAMMMAISKVTARAKGGLVDSPQLTMLGEAGEPELVIPQSGFREYVDRLHQDIRTSQARVADYSGTAARVSTLPAAGAPATHQTVNHINNTTIVKGNQIASAKALAKGIKGAQSLGYLEG